MNNKELGHRIVKLRKIKSLSQEDVSKQIEMSRPSYAQVEQGNRSLKVIELKRLSEVLNFSMDEIMSDSYSVNTDDLVFEESKAEYLPRISVPQSNLSKFKNLILYILERCAGKPNVGETVLYKLLYFSDFNYYEIYEEQLSGAIYRKLPNGPVPKDVDHILKDMLDKYEISLFKTEYYGYPQKRFIPMIKTDLKLFNGAEIEVIDQVIDSLSNMSAKTISAYSHEDMPWKASKNMEVIDYELAFYRTAPYSVREYNL